MKQAKWALAIAALAMAGAAGADVRQGVEAWGNGDYASAIAEWQPLAEAGDPDAQFNLGQAYKLGRGVPQDFERAERLFGDAARQGHLQAEANYGLMLFQRGEREEAMPWIMRAANRGEPRAQYIYGTALFNGDLVPRDLVRAYAMMSRSAAQGVPQAANSLERLDAQIPLAQREEGLALASRLEQSAAEIEVATAAPPPTTSTPPTRPARPAQQTLEPPPQQTAERPPEPNWQLPPAAPRPARQTPPEPTTAPLRQPTAQPAPQPAQAARSGDWRIQLGAFSERANAERLWRTMSRVTALSGLTPYLVAAGRLTRLQAGPFRTEAEANQACAAARRAGSECITARRR